MGRRGPRVHVRLELLVSRDSFPLLVAFDRLLTLAACLFQFLRSPLDSLRNFGFHPGAVLLERQRYQAWPYCGRMHWCHLGLRVSH